MTILKKHDRFSAVFAALSLCALSAWAQPVDLSDLQQMQQQSQNSGMSLGGGLGSLGSIGATAVGNSIRSADPLPSQIGGATPSSLARLPKPFIDLEPNEFQKFVLQTAGYKLPLYGQNLFEQQTSQPQAANGVMQPLSNVPVSADYPVGPGDQILVRGWGSLDIDARLVVDRNGMVNMPRVGAISLAGTKSSEVETVLRQAVSRYYKDFKLSVTFGQLRSITVYVVGMARQPGSYVLSSLSTLASGLMASGGPNENGSMRRVLLKRAGQQVAELDLYGFLSQGSNSGDVKLLDGDVIVIPPALGYVALVGKVNTPAVYEIRSPQDTLGDVLNIGGGLPTLADTRRVSLERLNPSKVQPRSVQTFALDEAGLKTVVNAGDILTVQAISTELSGVVTLRGAVAQPTRMAWHEGMRIKDVLPSKDVLLSRESMRLQDQVLFDAKQRRDAKGNLKWNKNVEEQGQDGTNNIRPNNNIGDLNKPEELGLVDPSQVGLLYVPVNWDYAVVERIDRLNQKTSLLPFSLTKVFQDPTSADNMRLEAGDVVTIFSANEVSIPVSKMPNYVRIDGEVAKPGIYQVKSGESLADVLQRAGGLTSDAYLFGAKLTRPEIQKMQEQNLQKLTQQLEKNGAAEIAKLSQSLSASASPADAGAVQAKVLSAQQLQEQSLRRMKNLKPEGRVALSLEPELYNRIDKLPNVALRNGDRLYIPPRSDYVHIFGAVNTEAALIYIPGKSVGDYLAQSGVSHNGDWDNIVLVRADGSAIARGSSMFSFSITGKTVMPGDAIVVPDKINAETNWAAVVRNTKDITQIFYQLGLGAAGLKALGY